MRIALVTPRFWPLGDACARHAGDFASAVSQLGAKCTILTTYVGNDKPREIDFSQFRVRSFLPPSNSSRSRWKYARNVACWLQENADSFDAIYCYGVDETTCAIVEKVQSQQSPVFIRATKGGPAGDHHWPMGGICFQRLQAAVRKAERIVTSTEYERAEWLKTHVEPSKVSVVPFGIGEWARPSQDRQAARSLLAATHPIFRIHKNARVALFVGELTKSQPLKRLVQNWKKLRRQATDFHLWFIGEGEGSEAVWNEIRRFELEEFVLMPGQFDLPEPLYAAADVVLHPGEHLESPLPLLEAAALGKPILAADSMPIKELLHGYAGVTYLPPDSESAWIKLLTQTTSRAYPPFVRAIYHEAEHVIRIVR